MQRSVDRSSSAPEPNISVSITAAWVPQPFTGGIPSPTIWGSLDMISAPSPLYKFEVSNASTLASFPHFVSLACPPIPSLYCSLPAAYTFSIALRRKARALSCPAVLQETGRKQQGEGKDMGNERFSAVFGLCVAQSVRLIISLTPCSTARHNTTPPSPPGHKF